MANEVKWIKITTDIFEPDGKLFAIESLHDGYMIEIVWFKLLVLTGKLNNNGFIINSAKIPFTDEMLSQAFRIELGTVQRALEIFQNFNMVEVVDNAYMISNWLEHQHGDRLDEIKDKNKERQQRYRDKQKALNERNVTHNVTHNVTRNVTNDVICSISNSISNNNISNTNKDIDIDIDNISDIDTEITDKPKTKRKAKEEEPKTQYGEFGNVLLKQSEYLKLVEKYGMVHTDECIQFLDKYIPNGKKYKSHFMAIIQWVSDAVNERKTRGNNNGYSSNGNGETHDGYMSDEDRRIREAYGCL